MRCKVLLRHSSGEAQGGWESQVVPNVKVLLCLTCTTKLADRDLPSSVYFLYYRARETTTWRDAPPRYRTSWGGRRGEYARSFEFCTPSTLGLVELRPRSNTKGEPRFWSGSKDRCFRPLPRAASGKIIRYCFCFYFFWAGMLPRDTQNRVSSQTEAWSVLSSGWLMCRQGIGA